MGRWGGVSLLRKGIIVAVMTTDGKAEGDLMRITRACCSCRSHSDACAERSVRLVV